MIFTEEDLNSLNAIAGLLASFGCDSQAGCVLYIHHKIAKSIERVARVCYKSEDKITPDGESAKKLVGFLVKQGHEAMLEHSKLSVLFTCDRGVANELVRHRIASFAQESTRYCNYSKEKFGGELSTLR